MSSWRRTLDIYWNHLYLGYRFHYKFNIQTTWWVILFYLKEYQFKTPCQIVIALSHRNRMHKISLTSEELIVSIGLMCNWYARGLAHGKSDQEHLKLIPFWMNDRLFSLEPFFYDLKFSHDNIYHIHKRHSTKYNHSKIIDIVEPILKWPFVADHLHDFIESFILPRHFSQPWWLHINNI